MKTRKQVKVLLIVLIGIFIPYPQKAHSQNYVPMKDDTKMAVKPKIEIKAYSFHLKQIRLLDSPFKTAMNADRKWLMETLNPIVSYIVSMQTPDYPLREPFMAVGKIPIKAVFHSDIIYLPCPCYMQPQEKKTLKYVLIIAFPN